MKTMDNLEEKEPEWMIPGWMPKYQITVMVGDGGLQDAGVDEPASQKIMFFSSEDSVE